MSYSVKVKLFLGALGGELAAELPFVLMHPKVSYVLQSGRGPVEQSSESACWVDNTSRACFSTDEALRRSPSVDATWKGNALFESILVYPLDAPKINFSPRRKNDVRRLSDAFQHETPKKFCNATFLFPPKLLD